ncbi:tetratricopeptide repeat protein [Actinokineospora bangkokensis]|uniref:Tetratricopeptide repeat protein n=1 Tax=Actinokineospora bangkokensis TaxID=1193682 RepID=A0A1Q9LK75_9PSEU|nr:tetratricopeptide repeat protein [Actinokineospora bangkokensis]OLR92451.1 hypothetical protein BJP25_20440 [Actinokineospora bangkokensis]
MTAPQDLADRLDAVWSMPHGRAQVAAVEALIRDADAAHDGHVAYGARLVAVTAYIKGAEPAKAFVPFAWAVAAHDRGEGDPRLEDHLLWLFKNVTGSLLRHPEVPLDRTMAVLEDMERRYRAAGHTMNPVHMYRTRIADHVGDRATADEQYRLWCATPRGEMADCVGCEPTRKVAYLTARGRHEEAVAVADPVLTGELSCVEQPAAILTALLEPYVRVGRAQDAADAHRRAYRLLQADRSELDTIADHVEFCARTGNPARALELVQRHLSWLDEPGSPMAEMAFSAAAALALRTVVEAGHEVTLTRDAVEVPAAELATELRERALALAARFDARNGTTAQGDQVRAVLAADQLVEHLPLTGTARRIEAAEAGMPARAEQAPALPDDPDELLALALDGENSENSGNGENSAVGAVSAAGGVEAVWARFDEVCPEPEGLRLAHRTARRGVEAWEREDLDEALARWQEAVERYDELGEPERALGVRGWVGTALCAAGRTDEGVAELESALAAAGGAGARPRVGAQLRLSQGLWLAGRHEESVASTRAAIEQAGDEPALLGEATSDLSRQLLALGEVDEAAEHAAAVLELVAEPGQVRHQAALLVGRAAARAEDFERAGALFAEACASEVPEVLAEAFTLRGHVAGDLGRPEEAVEHYAEAVAQHTRAGDIAAAAELSLRLAFLHSELERPEEAADAADEALPFLTDPEEVAQARYVLATSHSALGATGQALELFAEVRDHYAGTQEDAPLGQVLADTADVLDRLDQDAEAARVYAEAAAAYGRAQLPAKQLENLRHAAMSAHWAGDGDTALRTLAEADALAPVLDEDEQPWARAQRGFLDHAAARLFAAVDRFEEAVVRAAAAAARFEELEAAQFAAPAHALHGRLAGQLGRTAEARAAVERALELVDDEDEETREELRELLASL